MKSSTRSAVQAIGLFSMAFALAGCMASSPTAEAPAPAVDQQAQVTPATEPVATDVPAQRPAEFKVGEREMPLLPDGMTAIAVPAIERFVVPTYTPVPLLPGQEAITAFDIPKPARPSPTGRGRGFLATPPVSAPAAGGLSLGAPMDAPLGIGIEGGPPAPLAPPFVTTFDSTDFDDNPGLSGSFFIPPDSHGAAGSAHVVNVVNTTVRFHTKAGATTFHAGLASFFAGLAPLTATFDPKVIYDQFEDRFVVVTLEQTDTAFGDPADTSRIFLAVSDDGDPNGAWTVTAITSSVATPTCAGGTSPSSWTDYPGFAVDEEAVYITGNLFGFFSFGAPFCGTRLWIVDKGVVGGFYAGLAASVSPALDPYAGAGLATTTQPAHVFCTPGSTCPSPAGTYLTSYSGLSSPPTDFVQIVRVDSPLGAPAFTQQFLSVGDIEPIVAALPSAPQMGSTFPIATNDRRALNAVWRDDDFLWMAATIDPLGTPGADEATAHWWQLDTSGPDPAFTSLVQQGNIDGDTIAPDTHTFFPSIAVNSKNDVAIGFSASAATIFAGSYYTTREATDPAGFTSPATVLRAGMGPYERTFDSTAPCSPADSRWGDYSGISVDPTNECFWVYNEHALTPGTPLTGVCGDLPLPADGIEEGRWGTAHGLACLCSGTEALTTGAWKQVSMPCDPGPADTVADVFGDDLAGTYDTDWVVYRRDESVPAYVKMLTTDSLAVGEGYWVKSNIAAQSVSMGGKINTGADIPLTGVAAAPPAGCASSAGQCNKVGHPHNFDVCWADVLVDDGGPISLATADPGGVCQTTGIGCIMSRIAHKWTGAAYAPFDGVTPGMEGTLTPWDGFFVSANKPGIELRIPAMPGGPGLPCGPPAETLAPATPGGQGPWYIRLIAESGALVDESNVFGQASSSVDGFDAFDLQELDPFGNDYLTIVFPHPEWGAQAGNYSSDYHAYKPGPWNETWSFEVRSSDPGAAVLLRWEGPDAQLRRSRLVDNETHKVIRPRPDGTYAFTMSGPTRSFTWRLVGHETPVPRRFGAPRQGR